MSETFDHIISIVGLGLMIGRLLHRRNTPKDAPLEAETKVSVIVPCRNESANIEPLLDSLLKLEAVDYEILIVDDASTDDTARKAAAYQSKFPQTIRLIPTPEKPPGWVGKSWACWVGAQGAKGEFLLFTDADTRHEPNSLFRAMNFLRSSHADLISAPPFHQCGLWWEKLLGLFHMLPLVATKFSSFGPHQHLSRNASTRLFAIGQYLMFRRNTYFSIEGHLALRDSLAEDIDLARRVAEGRGTYAVYPRSDLYSVQMYSSFSKFVTGWSRIIRVGLPRMSLTAVLEIILVFHLFLSPSFALIPALLFLLWIQKTHGAFSAWGVVLFPISLFLFFVVTLKAQFDRFMRKGVNWHGRTYST